jgi:hypothetical protein
MKNTIHLDREIQEAQNQVNKPKNGWTLGWKIKLQDLLNQRIEDNDLYNHLK